MVAASKRCSISVTPQTQDQLEAAQKTHFFETTQTQMFQTLIKRGLESVRQQDLRKNDEKTGQNQDV